MKKLRRGGSKEIEAMFGSQSEVETLDNEIISARAYELWQARGCPEGSGDEDWETAKAQLMAEADAANQRRPFRWLFARLRNRAA